jgi:hypothetical protein
METLSFAADITNITTVINEALEELQKCKGKQRPGYDVTVLNHVEVLVQGLGQMFDVALKIVAEEVPLHQLRDYRVLNEVELLTKKSLAELLQLLRDSRLFSGFMRNKKLSEIGHDIEKAREKGKIWLKVLDTSRLQEIERRLDLQASLTREISKNIDNLERELENLQDLYAYSMEARWKRFYDKVVFSKAEENKFSPQTDSPRSYYVQIGSVRLKTMFYPNKAYNR